MTDANPTDETVFNDETVSTEDTVPIRPAATVVLLRDHADHGLQTFLLQRNAALEFAPSATVFPGGAVDPHDGAEAWLDHLASPSSQRAAELLGTDPGVGLAYWIAAARECFEEAGVLLGGPIGFDRTEPLLEICRRNSLRLDLSVMRYIGRFVTPAGSPRRYDTRFFLAAVDSRVEARADFGEAVAGSWSVPADALRDDDAGVIELIVPTRLTLEMLTGFNSTAAVLAAVAPPAAGSPPMDGAEDGQLIRLRAGG